MIFSKGLVGKQIGKDVVGKESSTLVVRHITSMTTLGQSQDTDFTILEERTKRSSSHTIG
jgi:hypothetical protein